jgi:hypothetical protein
MFSFMLFIVVGIGTRSVTPFVDESGKFNGKTNGVKFSLAGA